MADTIDRQKAIDAISEFLFYTSNFDGMRQGFDLSDWKWKIEGVLSDLPSSQPTQTNTPNTLDALDCVSREAVMDLIIETDPYWAEGMTRAIYNGVSKMPSAQPEIKCIAKIMLTEEQVQEAFEKAKKDILAAQSELKKGKWIIVTDSRGRHAECPYCGEWKYHSNQKFCGECGAEMEGEEE